MDELIELMMSSMIGIIGLIGLLAVASKARNKTAHIPSVVLTRYDVDETSGEISIEGRSPGILGFLLKLVGMGSISTFSANRQEMRVDARSMQGQNVILVPGDSASCVRASYYSPIWALFAIAMVLLFSLMIAFFFLMIDAPDFDETLFGLFMMDSLAVLFFGLAYLFGRKLVIQVDTHHGRGPSIGIAFKPSMLDGVVMDISALMNAANMLNQNMKQTAAKGQPESS